jgi:hypothetical protein
MAMVVRALRLSPRPDAAGPMFVGAYRTHDMADRPHFYTTFFIILQLLFVIFSNTADNVFDLYLIVV